MERKMTIKEWLVPIQAYIQVVAKGPPRMYTAKAIPELGERKTGFPQRFLPSELKIMIKRMSSEISVWVQIPAQHLLRDII